MAPKAPSKPKTKKAKAPSPKKKATAKTATRKATKSPAAKKATARKSAAKKAKKTAMPSQSTSSRAGRARAQKSATPKVKEAPVFVPRALIQTDDEDELMAHGGGGGGGYGRCGGRLLSSRLEQSLCNWLGRAGVVHSHSPRHYEVRFEEKRVAAYAPQIVLRGRGREGKSVVIEAVEDLKSPILRKIQAFRAQYGQEFYVIVVASDEVLEELSLATYDESCSTTNVNTLIARLAE